jgi:hypothetical protein
MMMSMRKCISFALSIVVISSCTTPLRPPVTCEEPPQPSSLEARGLRREGTQLVVNVLVTRSPYAMRFVPLTPLVFQIKTHLMAHPEAVDVVDDRGDAVDLLIADWFEGGTGGENELFDLHFKTPEALPVGKYRLRFVDVWDKDEIFPTLAVPVDFEWREFILN